MALERLLSHVPVAARSHDGRAGEGRSRRHGALRCGDGAGGEKPGKTLKMEAGEHPGAGSDQAFPDGVADGRPANCSWTFNFFMTRGR